MISPYLEKLILTGQAQYRRETVGLSGTMRIDVPVGCYVVITEVEMLPVLQTAGQQYGQVADSFTYEPVPANELQAIQYQVRAIIDQATVHNVTNRAGLQYNTNAYDINGEPRYMVTKTPIYTASKVATYWIVRKGISLNYIFQRSDMRLFGAQTDTVYLNDFASPLGPVSNNSTTYYRASLEDLPGSGVAEYYPQLPENFENGPLAKPPGNSYVYFTMANNFGNTRVDSAVGDGSQQAAYQFLNMPMLNVEFVIINALEPNQGSGIMKPEAFRY